MTGGHAAVTAEVRDVGGVAVALEGFAAGSTRVLDRLPHHPGPPAVRLVRGGTAGPPPPRAWDLETAGLRVWWQCDGSVVLEGSGACARVADGVAVIEAGADVRSERQFVELALMHLLAPHGRFVLHAGALAESDRAWLVVGPSGSGKSTVAAAALARGWTVLADDLVVVRSGPDGPGVLGIPVPVAVPAELGLAGTPMVGDARRRVLVEVPATPRWFLVHGVVVAAHDCGPGYLAPCSGDRVLSVLLASSFLVAERRRLAAYFPCAAALARLPAFTVGLAADPAVRLHALGDALARLVESGAPAASEVRPPR